MRPTKAIINLPAMRQNVHNITAATTSKVLWVIKANGYGHGLVKVAQTLESVNVDYFGVALLEEGIQLRKAGIKTPILVFGGLSHDQIHDYIDWDLTLTISSVAKLDKLTEAIANTDKTAKIHIKIDTGLSRVGINYQRIGSIVAPLHNAPKNIIIEGVYQQFAESDSDEAFTRLQFDRFKQAVGTLQAAGINPPLQHVCNSAAMAKYPDMHLSMVRAGRLLYGISHPSWNNTVTVNPTLSLVTEVCYFKVIKAGDTVGYMRTWKAKKQTRIVTLPLGYADGYPRAASNTSHVLINGKKYPTVGLVAMDQMMVDIGPDGEAYCGDKVVLLGAQGDQKITVYDLATAADTIAHEIITRISDRVPRVYVD